MKETPKKRSFSIVSQRVPLLWQCYFEHSAQRANGVKKIGKLSAAVGGMYTNVASAWCSCTVTVTHMRKRGESSPSKKCPRSHISTALHASALGPWTKESWAGGFELETQGRKSFRHKS